MTRIALSTAVAALLCGPALAAGPTLPPAEPTVTPPPALPAELWTGPYAGVQFGMGWATISEEGDPDVDGDGYVAGVHLGYNHDFGRLIAGVEVDYNAADIEFDNGDPDVTIETLSHLKLRAGIDLGQSWLYVAGGSARAKDAEGTSATEPFYGIGFEHRFSNRLSGGVEYLVHQFDDFYTDGIDLDLNTLQARVSYHF